MLIVLGLGMLVSILAPKKEGGTPATTPKESHLERPTPAAKPVQEATAPRDEHCFDYGAAIAKVYMANINQAAQVDLMASQMMERGCSDRAGDEGEDCVRQCKTGFKVEARDLLK
ncbi:hypothetical protein [Zoogloea sp. LCSB751]|uniref:hypothetical protein n=1 Tax=Zoogloea sp. LCSB751 TaxID=1965277 RepID=UPI0020B13297|nr:hypothetical protein [Zoogloea sp. LCSB751]